MDKILILDESKITSKLNHGSLHSVYKYQDGGDFIVKALDKIQADQDMLVDFNLEYNILSNLDIDEVPCNIKKARFKHRPAFIYNYIVGHNLKNNGFSILNIKDFLPLAIGVTETLGKIHQANIVHNDIKPENIILGEDGKVYIIDFSSASKLSSRNVAVQSPSQIRGTIGYMAPEAFGRMNRNIDNRSDLYSLGVMFYLLLKGKLPFETEDPLELIHFHMAKKPDLSDLPPALGEILGKLMAKTPEDRYQSAWGLKHDLLQSSELMERFGQILDFPIGTKDYSSSFRIPEKLYGREKEIQQLLEKFEYVANGNSQLLLVSGYSGIGKTALVGEIHKPVTQVKGNFLYGKFDQFQRDVPYYALIRAFDQFIDQLLKESKSYIETLRSNIKDAVGINAQLIIDLIPSVELIIGPQPPIKALPPTESQNRFVNTLLSFIKLFGNREHPLVIMCDDVQWADQASLDLFTNLLTDESSKYIMIIGAFRSNEVDENHPLMLSLEKLKKKTNEISSIELHPLQPAEITLLIADTLNTTVANAQDISDLIYEKTNGNPFFVTQFLNRLHEDELIRFEYEKLSWQWEVQVIHAMNITDNVVDLMMDKLSLLPDGTKAIIRMGACVGNMFDLKTLTAVTQKDSLSIASALWPAVEARILLPETKNYKMSQINYEPGFGLDQSQINVQYKFAHDRIQQAAYALIPTDESEKIHLEIGRLLLISGEEMIESALFEILGHLNAGSKLVTENQEKIEFAKLNLKAGKKSKGSLAYESSLVYLNAGINFLPEDSWSNPELYPVIFELSLEKAEANYLTGNYEVAETTSEEMLNHVKDTDDRARIYLIKGLLNTTIGRFDSALEAIKIGLKIYGLEVPKVVDDAAIGQNLAEIEKLIAGKAIADLYDLKETQSHESFMKIMLLAIGATPAFWIDKKLWVWVISKMVHISISEGNTDISDLGYSAFGLFIGSSLGDYSSGYEYGKLAIRLNTKYKKTENLAKMGVIFGQLISPWKTHIRENIDYAKEGFKAGIETGDMIYAGYCAVHLAWDLFLIGTPLSEVGIESDKLFKFFEKSKDDMGQAAKVIKRISERLQGQNLSALLEKDQHAEDQYLNELKEMFNAFPYASYLILKMRLLYHNGDYHEVLKLMPPFLENVHAILGSAFVSEAYFFHSLATIREIENQPKNKKELLMQLNDNINQLKTWSDHAPMNYGYRYHLVMAEKAHLIDKNISDAEDNYELAINFANENGFMHDEALCAALAGKFYKDINRLKIAKTYLIDAVIGFQRWGANSIVNELMDTHADLLNNYKLQKEGELNTTSRSSTGVGMDLDWRSLVKATSALSGEIVLKNLLDKFIQILIESAGAQKCFIIYFDNDLQAFFIEAEASLGLEENKILQHEPLEKNSFLSKEIVHYVHRSGKTLVLDDVKQDARFNATPYILNQKEAKSIFATNLIMQNRPNAIIYLENNLATAAFSESRVEFIRVLAAQVGISLENALIYRDLEEKVNTRTLTIEKQKEIIFLEKNKSDDLLYNILPKATADELKLKGKSTPKFFEEVTVLFTDFVGFTKITENISPEELIENLNQCFLAFDEIAEKHNLEKIKTIGDAYMCANGVPLPDKDHAIKAIKAGLQIQSFIKKWNKQREKDGKQPWPLRVGIHSGPVIAGVVGKRKFAYDIWGDAVNVAARMESGSEPDKVNISSSTYALVKDQIEVEYRGKVTVKGKGEVEMFFVKKLK